MNDTEGRAPERPKPEPDDQPRGGILMGRPFGVPVYVTPSWFLVAALITWIFGSRLADVLPDLGAARYLLAFSFAVAFYGSVLVHELAHTLVGLRYKLGVRRIQLQFLGGVSEIEKEADRPWREFWLAFVGPLLSLVLGGAFWLGLRAVEPATVPGVLLAGLMVSNLVVAAFNLLPGLPLDGGRMLRAVVWACTGKPMKGTLAAVWVGRALAVAVVLGLPVFSSSQDVERSATEAMVDGVLAAILGFIIWQGAGNSLRNARLKEVLPRLRIRELARRSIDVPADTPLGEAMRRAREAHAGAIVVVDGRGEPTAVVKESAVSAVPEHRRPWVAVTAVSRDLEPGLTVPVDLAGEQILDVLRRAPATEYLVVRPDGSVYGVLSLSDLERRLTAALLGRAAGAD
ncbi:Zn-dependent protease [Kitasatospora sp. SolWspMP-SS2h]|uniref:site-2 protease family protein n=1 Tax=Kitasatospora sp. SolWspMP-SS2h TaxID=1305729 RepID=UPI000DBA9CA9|nr:site-2 protease family protein [Kitasatospora sp. SolWspMP-SS2h]RAJ46297.1 Zn-dependent protease [Kitasatospora sp. SolWspMP-SS2h]